MASFRVQCLLLVSAFLLALVWSVLTVPVEAHAKASYSHTIKVKGHKEVTAFATRHCSGEPDVVLPGDKAKNIRSVIFWGKGVWRAHGKRHKVKSTCVYLWKVKPGLVKVRAK